MVLKVNTDYSSAHNTDNTTHGVSFCLTVTKDRTNNQRTVDGASSSLGELPTRNTKQAPPPPRSNYRTYSDVRVP